MKNIQNALLIAVLMITGTIVACHNHNENDTNAPVLTIENPAEGAVLSGEVHVHGLVTDEGLHEMSIKVIRDIDNFEYLNAAPEVHDATEYDFDEHFTPGALTGETAVTLTITAEDHHENVTTKTVKFKVKP